MVWQPAASDTEKKAATIRAAFARARQEERREEVRKGMVSPNGEASRETPREARPRETMNGS